MKHLPGQGTKLNRQLNNVCVFCGSSSGGRPVYEEAAVRLGTLLSHLGIALVFGGGRVGLLGALADSVLAAGGYGSWEEFCEVIAWAQLGIHCKPRGVLNVAPGRLTLAICLIMLVGVVLASVCGAWLYKEQPNP